MSKITVSKITKKIATIKNITLEYESSLELMNSNLELISKMKKLPQFNEADRIQFNQLRQNVRDLHQELKYLKKRRKHFSDTLSVIGTLIKTV